MTQTAPRMRALKARILSLLRADGWRAHLDDIAGHGMSAVGPLLACLHAEPPARHRAAAALGPVVRDLPPDAMRDVMRRLMWRMNEESGGIGWGVPEAFGEILAASPQACREFHRVLISWIVKLDGREDNFCDHAILRRSCCWAVGRLAQDAPEFAAPARPWLRREIAMDEDPVCRAMAAWSLGVLGAGMDDLPALRALEAEHGAETCEIFDGDGMRTESFAEIARRAMDSAGNSGLS